MILNKRFNDFEEYATTAREWNVNFRQMDSGHFTGRLIQIPSKYVQLTFVHFGRRLYIEGETPKDFYNFSLPLNPNSDTLWYGQNYTQSSIGIGPIENYIEGISQAGLMSIELSISKKYMDYILNNRDNTDIIKFILPQSIIECDSRQLYRFQKKIHDIINLLTSTSNLISNKYAINDLLNTIPSELLNTLILSNVKMPPITLEKRRHALKRSMEYIFAYSHEYPSIGEICKVAEVSERTLEYAFKERYGVSPLSFLNTIRLNNVRSILKKSDPKEIRVTDVAGVNGFWHMGKFSADYKNLFGDFPSETLKRKSKGF